MRSSPGSGFAAFLVAGALLVISSGGGARAQDAAEVPSPAPSLAREPPRASAPEPAHGLPRDRAVSIRLRISPPLGSFSLVGDQGNIAFGLAGLSLGVEIRQLVAFEAGVGAIVNDIYGSDPDYFVRLGIVRTTRDWRKLDGTGWMAQVDLLAGYRQVTRSGSPDGHDGSEVTQGATGHVGIEWSDRRPSGSALLLRVIGGLTLPITQRTTGYWGGSYFSDAGHLTFAVDFGFNLGVAF